MVKLNRLQAFIREYTENYNIKFNTENREVLGVDLSVSFLMLFFIKNDTENITEGSTTY